MTNIEFEPMNVMITFQCGSRFQYQIEVPVTDNMDLQVWFNTHKFITAREATNTANLGEVCVDDRVTFINLDSISQIKELDW